MKNLTKISLILLLLLNTVPSASSEVWPNSSFDQRIVFNITNVNGINNVVNITTTQNTSDRWYNVSNNPQPLSYYNLTGNGNAWVNLSVLNGDGQIAKYVNNSNFYSDGSSMNNTFALGDDFVGSDLDTNKFAATGTVSLNNSFVSNLGISSWNTRYINETNTKFSTGSAIEIRYRVNLTNSNQIMSSSDDLSFVNGEWAFGMGSAGNLIFNVGGSTKYDSGNIYSTNNILKIRLWRPNSTYLYAWTLKEGTDSDFVLRYSGLATTTDSNNNVIKFLMTYAGTPSVDYITIRPFSLPIVTATQNNTNTYSPILITSWGNNNTNNQNINLNIPLNKNVYFNITTNIGIEQYCFVEGSNPCIYSAYNNTNQLSSTNSFSNYGATTYTVNVISTIYSNTLTWNVFVVTNFTPLISIKNNSKTNTTNKYGMFINSGESITFTAITNDPNNSWNWYRDGVIQSNNFDNYTTSFISGSYHYILLNTTNFVGNSNTIFWGINVLPAMAVSPGDDIELLNETQVSELSDAIETNDMPKLVNTPIEIYVNIIGISFYAVIWLIVFGMIWIKQQSINIPSIIGIIFGGIIITFLPAQYQLVSQILIVFGIFAVIYVFFKGRG